MSQNGPVKDSFHQDSTAQSIPVYNFAPVNMRNVLQRQMQAIVDRHVDAVQGLSIGNFDGRYIGNFPGVTEKMENAHGRFYHIVGVSKGGDLSVAAP